MTGTTHRVARWSIAAAGVMLGLLALYLSIFVLPYPLFPHLEHAGFHVDSDHEIPPAFEAVLDDARRRVDAMELFHGQTPPRLFVCRSHRLFGFYVRTAGKRHAGQGLVISIAGNAFFSQPTIDAIARRSVARPHRSRLEGSWAAAIAHAVAHDLMTSRLGDRGARRLPVWNAEGYADCAANPVDHASDVELRRRIARWLDDDTWQGPTGGIDRRHFGWQLLVEYLTTIEGRTFRGLIDPSLTESGSRSRMLAWYDRTR